MEEELEALESIYSAELVVTRKTGGATVIFQCSPEPPCFVSTTLTLEMASSGPPEFSIDSKNLDEREYRALVSELNEVLATYAEGDQMGFQLIELTRERIEDCNRQAACQICLSALFDPAPKKCLGVLPKTYNENWVQSPCGHQYHSACLARWWTQCVVNKQKSELKKGGDLAEVGREREAVARQEAMAQALEAAITEAEASAASAKQLRDNFDEFTAAAAEKSKRHSKSGAVRAEALRAETRITELQSALNQMEARASAGAEAVHSCRERYARAESQAKLAEAASAEAVSRSEVDLMASIPCPVCRSSLELNATPFDCAEFSERAKTEAKNEAAKSDDAGAAEERGPSCQVHLSPDLLAMVRATQQKQRALHARRTAGGE